MEALHVILDPGYWMLDRECRPESILREMVSAKPRKIRHSCFRRNDMPAHNCSKLQVNIETLSRAKEQDFPKSLI